MLSKFIILIVCIISTILFSSLFKALNQSTLQLFQPIQKFTNKLKRKKLYSLLTDFLFLTINGVFLVYFNITDIIIAISIGFFCALSSIIFEEIPTKQES